MHLIKFILFLGLPVICWALSSKQQGALPNPKPRRTKVAESTIQKSPDSNMQLTENFTINDLINSDRRNTND